MSTDTLFKLSAQEYENLYFILQSYDADEVYNYKEEDNDCPYRITSWTYLEDKKCIKIFFKAAHNYHGDLSWEKASDSPIMIPIDIIWQSKEDIETYMKIYRAKNWLQTHTSFYRDTKEILDLQEQLGHLQKANVNNQLDSFIKDVKVKIGDLEYGLENYRKQISKYQEIANTEHTFLEQCALKIIKNQGYKTLDSFKEKKES
jgi:hypothetical protein